MTTPGVTTQAEPIEPMLTREQVAELVQCRPNQVMALVSRGKFPRPAINEPRFKRWSAYAVRAWLHGQR